MSIDLEELYFDDENLDKLAAHRVTPDEVIQVQDDEYRLLTTNTGPDRRASHLMLGRTHGGRLLLVPIERVLPGVWRPVTAFEPTSHQSSRYRRSNP